MVVNFLVESKKKPPVNVFLAHFESQISKEYFNGYVLRQVNQKPNERIILFIYYLYSISSNISILRSWSN